MFESKNQQKKYFFIFAFLLVFKQSTLRNWNKFIFYKQFGGLNEYAEEKYPEEFFKPEDQHPLPLTHYKWVRDIMYQSNLECPPAEMDKLINFKRDFIK